MANGKRLKAKDKDFRPLTFDLRLLTFDKKNDRRAIYIQE